jgi:hypothetical protein
MSGKTSRSESIVQKGKGSKPLTLLTARTHALAFGHHYDLHSKHGLLRRFTVNRL